MKDKIKHVIGLRPESTLAELFLPYCHRYGNKELSAPLLYCTKIEAGFQGFLRAHVSLKNLQNPHLQNVRCYQIPLHEILFALDVEGNDPQTIGFLQE